jgi:hypothetical protein
VSVLNFLNTFPQGLALHFPRTWSLLLSCALTFLPLLNRLGCAHRLAGSNISS